MYSEAEYENENLYQQILNLTNQYSTEDFGGVDLELLKQPADPPLPLDEISDLP